MSETTTQPQFLSGEWRDPPRLIDVMVGGQFQRLPVSSLSRVVGSHEDDKEIANWVEYSLDGQIVHRSAAVYLKEGLQMSGVAGLLT